MNVFSNFKNNIKKTWVTLNKLTGKTTQKTTVNNIIYNDRILDIPSDIAEAFNQFFSSVASNLESKLPPPTDDPMEYLQGNFDQSLEIPQINIDLIFKIVKSLPNKKANIYDFSPLVIKENIHLLAHPLKLLFNQSISAGQFPEILENARVTPLYKKALNMI